MGFETHKNVPGGSETVTQPPDEAADGLKVQPADEKAVQYPLPPFPRKGQNIANRV